MKNVIVVLILGLSLLPVAASGQTLIHTQVQFLGMFAVLTV